MSRDTMISALHGTLWHRTSRGGLERILKDGMILPNTGQLEPTYPQTFNSYARKIGAIALFDFVTPTQKKILEQEVHWASFLCDLEPVTIVIQLDYDLLKRHLIANDSAAVGPVLIPVVEVWSREPIPTSAFLRYLIRSPYDESFYETVLPGPDALAQIDRLSAQLRPGYPPHDPRAFPG